MELLPKGTERPRMMQADFNPPDPNHPLWEACERGAYTDFDGNSRVILGGDRRIAVVQVSSRSREDNANAALKIVMLTAKGRDTEVAKGLALGADAYVTKPFSTKDLVAKVKSMLGIV